MTSVIDDDTEKKEQPESTRNRHGWVSPNYSRSEQITLDEQTLVGNRCVGFKESGIDVEAYEVLKAQILKRTEADMGATVMITSALPGEGKTLTSVNLAFSMAREFTQTVLLVDCDLKNNTSNNCWGYRMAWG